MSKNRPLRPRGVTFLAVWLVLLGVFATISSLYLWGEGFLWTFPADADYIFPVSDLLVTVPAVFLAAAGLWRMTWWGYAVANFVAGILVYSSVGVFVMLFQQGPPYPFQFVLPPISGLLIVVILVIYLWRIREQFGA